MKILVTGGTVFVSKYVAEYFVNKGHEVFVLNRNTRPQVEGVQLINCERNNLKDILKGHHFDAVLDITAYTRKDVEVLLSALGEFDNYILISTSAVYSERDPQPFTEEQQTGRNIYWGEYSANKIEAEEYLLEKVPHAYIIRPPYIYGKMNNLYREAFVFDCAEKDMPFYIPKDGKMPLQFFDIEDLSRFMELLLEKQPEQRIFNVGNKDVITISQWVELCYEVVGKTPEFKYVSEDIPQRSYFPFIDYSYILDVSKQNELLPGTKPMLQGLREAYEWYKNNREAVRKRPLIEFIEEKLIEDRE
ncbi:NAD-dependent epimerase/dehydratase family protein [Alloiococcus sp. CFN-8]|uniref:NAD-dependent epimerase/dehydratase family protein n=1 Tax=Alloiococcus sp. CFN-8 TaxID=3416081 RepID=UPI003CEE5F70